MSDAANKRDVVFGVLMGSQMPTLEARRAARKIVEGLEAIEARKPTPHLDQLLDYLEGKVAVAPTSKCARKAREELRWCRPAAMVRSLADALRFIEGRARVLWFADPDKTWRENTINQMRGVMWLFRGKDPGSGFKDMADIGKFLRAPYTVEGEHVFFDVLTRKQDNPLRRSFE